MLRPNPFSLSLALAVGACSVELGGLGPVADAGFAPAPVAQAPSSDANAIPGTGPSPRPGLPAGTLVDAAIELPPLRADAAQAEPGAVDAGLPSSDATTAVLTLTSPDVGQGDRLPAQFTCSGGHVAPTFVWSGAPQATQSFALVLTTPTNVLGSEVPYTRWAIWNIPAARRSLPGNGLTPSEVPEAAQSSNESDLGAGALFGGGGLLGGGGSEEAVGRRYRGPCSRGWPQTFSFTLYALGGTPTYPDEWSSGVTPDAVLTWLEGSADVLARASLSGISP